MVHSGIVTKIQNDLVWYSTSPEGATCADCSCEKPVRTLVARLAPEQTCVEGDRVIVQNKLAPTLIAMFLLLVLTVGPGVLVWHVAAALDELGRAGLTMAGVAGGLLVASVAAAPFRMRFLPVAKVVHLSLAEATN